MRLISCNIYGFGTLSDYNVVFDSRLHSILGPNGYGKSTLFDFIRVMLYGLASARANETSLSMRSHYRPFGGKAFGGVLTLDTREGVISVERLFHATTASKDTLKITDSFGNDLTGTKYKGIDSLGYHFLGLDEEAYDRTVAFRDLEVNDGVGANKTISGKLNSIATSIDVGQYDRAMDALNQMIKSLSGKGSKNVSKISALNQNIQNLTKRIKELEPVLASLEGHHQNLAQYKQDHDTMEKELERAVNLNRDRERWQTYQSKLNQVQGLRQELQSILDKYPSGIPSIETEQKIRQAGKQLKEIEAALASLTFSESDQTKLNLLKERYPSGPIPSEALNALDAARTERDGALGVLENTQFPDTQRLEQLKKQFSHWQNSSLSALEQWLHKSEAVDQEAQRLKMIPLVEPPRGTLNLDKANLPTQEQMQRVETMAGEYKSNELQIQSLATLPSQSHARYNKLIALVGLVVVIIGIIMQVTGILNYGVAVMFFGLAVVMFSFILKGSSKTDNDNNPVVALTQRNAVLENQLKTFFARYQRFGTDFAAYADELKTSVSQYKRYILDQEQQKQRIEQARSALTAARTEIVEFISHVVGQDYLLSLGALDRGCSNTGNATHGHLRHDIQSGAFDLHRGTKESRNSSGMHIGFDIDEDPVEDRIHEDENLNKSGNHSNVYGSSSNNLNNIPNRYSGYSDNVRSGVDLNNINLTQTLQTLCREYQELQKLEKAFAETKERSRFFEDKAKQCEQKISAIILEYNIPEEIPISVLSQESAELDSLSRNYNQYVSRTEEYARSRSELKEKINSIYQQLSLSVPEDLTTAAFEYEHDLKFSQDLNSKINSAETDAEQYRQSIGLTEEPKVIMSEQQLKEQQQRIKELEGSIGRLSSQIAQAESDTAVLPSLIEQRQQKQLELQQAHEELEVIKKTQTFILQANRNLLDRYVRPIMDKYQDQIKRLLPWLESVTMDHNYKVSFKKDTDVAHNCEHLSSGERTCLELALRLALIENMFHGDYPVLMMDDPFSELDPVNLQRALEILKGVSTKMQVVYFSCSPERVIS